MVLGEVDVSRGAGLGGDVDGGDLGLVAGPVARGGALLVEGQRALEVEGGAGHQFRPQLIDRVGVGRLLLDGDEAEA
ncbi:MAG: hypothetical protein AN484_15400 [Aphanizomenon flos-aquae WA102]|uniref:Uncharacterized protein n=1 Tax=Aphanizomenon flos-aquae WA102 TaxID=1710896 RepID=A0A1B7X0G9_APHFL|nr:MAG: hypothetical protein AN484_15400 [Aphanizomenon flos-aquae WA102]